MKWIILRIGGIDNIMGLKRSKEIEVLAIGNSFSQNAVEFLHDLALSDGVVLHITNLYIGGCSLETHWNNVSNNAANYELQMNGKRTDQMVTVADILKSKEWDVITLQQASHFSGMWETYLPFLSNLAEYVHEQSPKSTILIHQTWAYETGYERLSLYENSQKVMFDKIKQAYAEASKWALPPYKLGIIPCGEAFQIARDQNPIYQTVFGDESAIRLNIDGFHATNYGKYLLSAVWYEVLTGNQIRTNPYIPEGIDKEQISYLKQCAHEAVVKYGWC